MPNARSNVPSRSTVAIRDRIRSVAWCTGSWPDGSLAVRRNIRNLKAPLQLPLSACRQACCVPGASARGLQLSMCRVATKSASRWSSSSSKSCRAIGAFGSYGHAKCISAWIEHGHIPVRYVMSTSHREPVPQPVWPHTRHELLSNRLHGAHETVVIG
jgi:hypothetical protein